MILKNQKFFLKNGLRVLFLEKEDLKTTALGVAVNAGPYYEKDGEEGISHLLEHLIGRANIGKSTLREKVYQNGGLLDAATSVSQTFYHLYTFPHKLLDLTKILVEGVFTPTLTSNALKFSKESVISELAFNQDFASYEILREMVWKDKKLSRSIVGSKDTMMGISIEGLKNYHNYFYSANNTSLVLIGPSFSDSLLKELEKIPNNKDFNQERIDLSLRLPSFKVYQERNLHSVIAFAFPTKGYKGLGEDRHLFNLAATALNDYYVWQLGKLGLVYEASWNWNVFPESGDFVILLESLDNNHIVAALKEGLKLISAWPKLSLSQERFDLLKSHRVLDLRIGASLVDALPLFTRNFSSSEEAHTYEDAIEVYEKATMDETLRTVKNVLLETTPYTVVSLGEDSLHRIGQVNQLLEEYYKA